VAAVARHVAGRNLARLHSTESGVRIAGALQMHVFVNVVLGCHPRVAFHPPDCTHPRQRRLGLITKARPSARIGRPDDGRGYRRRRDLAKSYKGFECFCCWRNILALTQGVPSPSKQRRWTTWSVSKARTYSSLERSDRVRGERSQPSSVAPSSAAHGSGSRECDAHP
jgi:hypothetical protein